MNSAVNDARSGVGDELREVVGEAEGRSRHEATTRAHPEVVDSDHLGAGGLEATPQLVVLGHRTGPAAADLLPPLTQHAEVGAMHVAMAHRDPVRFDGHAIASSQIGRGALPIHFNEPGDAIYSSAGPTQVCPEPARMHQGVGVGGGQPDRIRRRVQHLQGGVERGGPCGAGGTMVRAHHGPHHVRWVSGIKHPLCQSGGGVGAGVGDHDERSRHARVTGGVEHRAKAHLDAVRFVMSGDPHP